ncbi:MAG: glycogen synthase GlgA [Proteobacteria bacterium]|nr:glycogen synthase GlgA [Pseudomonadota bacterium]
MDILFISPEVSPFARAGGLGDVSYYLPMALADRGHRLWVVTPRYRQTADSGYDLTLESGEVRVPMSWQEKTARIYSTRIDKGITVYFIGCDELYNRPGLYGNEFGNYEDNAERFIFFSRAAVETMLALNLAPDLIHCHDWPTGLIPAYLKTLYRSHWGERPPATVFTFHNLGSQGLFWHYDFAMTGLGWDLFTPDSLEFHGQLNMTKAGLVFADLISTVSRKYAEEVLTPEFGFGLEGVLQVRKPDTHSVLNGVDYQVWDPALDPFLTSNYGPETLQRKEDCRRELAEIFGLDVNRVPLVAVISRLLDRKGFDLISGAVDNLLKLDLKMVFMGMGEDKYHVFLENLARNYPDRVGVKIMYDKSLAHKIIAGADIFLMPSRYEPCGLEQLYGLKYGTVPVVRATGGLDDTIIDVREAPDQGTGFKFQHYTPDALHEVMDAAVGLFQEPDRWTALMRRGMAQDYSWDRAAGEYERLFEIALEKAGRR